MGIRRDVVAIAAWASATIGACGGPLDSPTPPPPGRDGSADSRSDIRSDLRPDLRPDSRPDLRPDLVEDRPAGDSVDGRGAPDAGRDAGITLWPVIPGCVTGLPPLPALNPGDGSQLTFGCAELTRTGARLVDSTRHGVVFSATLDPPIPGLGVTSPGALCAGAIDAPISIRVVDPTAVQPPDRFITTTLVVAIQTSAAPRLLTYLLSVSLATIHFSLDSDVIDFGDVPLGAIQSRSLTVTNASDSAAFSTLYFSPVMSDPFWLSSPVTMGNPATPLETGRSAPLLNAWFSATMLGSFESIFSVSPFAPDILIHSSCGDIRTVILRARATVPGGPP